MSVIIIIIIKNIKFIKRVYFVFFVILSLFFKTEVIAFSISRSTLISHHHNTLNSYYCRYSLISKRIKNIEKISENKNIYKKFSQSYYLTLLNSNMRYLDSFKKEDSNLTQKIGKSAKYIVSLVAAFFIIFNESWIPMYYILCGVVNSTLSKILKHIFKQPRPIKSMKKGYGLPSSHAQSIFYFATIVSISSVKSFNNPILSIFISSMIWIYSYLACSWRVTSNLHTVFQTIVGFVLGTVNGIIVSYYEKDMKLILEKYLKASSIDISVAIGIRLLISLSGFIVIYSREIKSFLKKK